MNCRRAAAAAFQEAVGRQGDFLHGIDIVTAADYFSLGTRANAYRIVGAFIAQYDEYRFQLIDELLSAKLRHWVRLISCLDLNTRCSYFLIECSSFQALLTLGFCHNCI